MSGHQCETTPEEGAVHEAELRALAVRREILRKMTPGERFRIGAELYELGIDLMRAGIRAHGYPDVEKELRRRLVPAHLWEGFERERARRGIT